MKARGLRQGEDFRADDRPTRSLERGILNELAQIDNARALLAVAQSWLVIGISLVIGHYFFQPWAVIPVIILLATRQQALFVLAHDAAHYRLFSHRGVNDWIGCLCAAPLGLSMHTYRIVHRLHHNHLYQPNDPDLPLHGGYPRGRGYLIKKLLGDLTGRTAYKTYAYFFGVMSNKASASLLRDTSVRLQTKARIDRWFVVSLQLALLSLAIISGWWIEYLLLWCLPLITILQALLRLRAICEHGAVTDTQSPLRAARTNLAPRWLLWLFFPHSVNYHIEHHLYPAIPHYRLAQCHELLRDRGLLNQAEVCRIEQTLPLIFSRPTNP